MTEIC